jgi:indole-3-glycerol phosphate synthase
LQRIVETKRREVEQARVDRPVAQLRRPAETRDPPRDFHGAVAETSADGPNLIAEIKKRSPSAGLIVEDFDPVRIARTYHRHGAAALSVLTDETYFQGRVDDLCAVKEAVPLPVLRKDFIVDEYQLTESRAAGADAVLLIAEVLGAAAMAKWIVQCHKLTLFPLVEVHTAENLQTLLSAAGLPGPRNYLLGINNRDLDAQRTDLGTMARLAELLPAGVTFVAESGIAIRADVLAAQRAGACAVLVGESLLRATDLGAAVDRLLGRSTNSAAQSGHDDRQQQ